MFIRVDLPAPFSPSSAWTSPSRRSKLTSSFATVPGKRFVMCSISRTTGRSGMRAIIVWPPHGRKPLGGQACRRDSALRARDLEVAVGDLLRDVVELGDQGVAIGRVRADLAVADAVVRDVVQRVAPTFEVAVDDLLDRVEHRDVDLLRGAREDVGLGLPTPAGERNASGRACGPARSFLPAPPRYYLIGGLILPAAICFETALSFAISAARC